MTRKPSYQQIIKIYFDLNGKLHNEFYSNTSPSKIFRLQMFTVNLQILCDPMWLPPIDAIICQLDT